MLFNFTPYYFLIYQICHNLILDPQKLFYKIYTFYSKIQKNQKLKIKKYFRDTRR